MALVIGLDLSLNGTGVCDVNGYASSLVFKGRKNDPKGDGRLRAIYDEVESSIQYCGLDHGKPVELAVIEALPNYGTGSKALGLVHGVVRMCLADNDVRAVYLSPSPLKKFATGNGNASKDQMREAIYQSGEVSVADLDNWDDNAVDAFWLREAGLAYLGHIHLGMRADVYDVRKMMKTTD